MNINGTYQKIAPRQRDTNSKTIQIMTLLFKTVEMPSKGRWRAFFPVHETGWLWSHDMDGQYAGHFRLATANQNQALFMSQEILTDAIYIILLTMFVGNCTKRDSQSQFDKVHNSIRMGQRRHYSASRPAVRPGRFTCVFFIFSIYFLTGMFQQVVPTFLISMCRQFVSK